MSPSPSNYLIRKVRPALFRPLPVCLMSQSERYKAEIQALFTDPGMPHYITLSKILACLSNIQQEFCSTTKRLIPF